MKTLLTLMAALGCLFCCAPLSGQNLDLMGNPCDDCAPMPEVDPSLRNAGGYNTFTIVSTFNSPNSSPMELAWDGSSVWLCVSSGGTLYRIDPNTGATQGTITIPVTYAAGLTYDGTNLWVSDNTTKSIKVVDPSNGAVLANFPHPTGTTRYVTGLAWDGTNLFNNVPGSGSIAPPDTLFYFSPSIATLNKWPTHGDYPTGAAFDGVNLWVSSNWPSPVIYQCDPTTYAKLDSFVAPGGQYPNGLTWDGCHLWVCNNANDQLFKLQMPNAPSGPVASFATSVSLQTVNFTDQSSFANSYFWDFGDGNTSTQQNPSHTYSTPGSYTVCLTTSNACGSDSACGVVTIACAAPQAGFSFSTSFLTTTFSNSSSGGSYTWFFGDGTTSTAANPVHSYPGPGNYNACLIVNDSCGADTTCSNVVIVCPAPQASFTFVPNNLSVQFTSTGSGGTQNWDFGDGNASSSANPQHTYAAPGNYTVCLAISDSCGSDTSCLTIIVTCPIPQAGFTSTASMLTVDFTDQSFGANAWAWDFGDGNTSTVQNPSHTYAGPGTYVACLTVGDICGSTTACDTLVVTQVAIDPALLQQVKVYPNPATDRVRVEFEAAFGSEMVSIEVFDAQGRRVLQNDLDGDAEIAVGHLARGLYHYRMQARQGLLKTGTLLLWNQ